MMRSSRAWSTPVSNSVSARARAEAEFDTGVLQGRLERIIAAAVRPNSLPRD
jgi:hypothetical protein